MDRKTYLVQNKQSQCWGVGYHLRVFGVPTGFAELGFSLEGAGTLVFEGVDTTEFDGEGTIAFVGATNSSCSLPIDVEKRKFRPTCPSNVSKRHGNNSTSCKRSCE